MSNIFTELKNSIAKKSTSEDKKSFRNMISSIEREKSSPNASGMYKECYNFPDHVVLKATNTPSWTKVKPAPHQIAIARLKNLGFKTPDFVYQTKYKGDLYQIQTRAKGKPLFKLTQDAETVEEISEIKTYNKERFIELLSAPSEHYVDFVKSMFIAFKIGFCNDFHPANIFYDKEEGFSFIDLPNNLSQINRVPNLNRYLTDNNKLTLLEFERFSYNLFKPFFSSFYSDYPQVYKNLIGHKLLEGIEKSGLNITQHQNYPIFECFLTGDKNQLVKNHPEFIEADSINDSYIKYTLIDMGLVKGNPLEEANLSTIKNRDIRVSYDINHLHLYSKANQGLDKEYFLRCLDSFTINNKPAFEHYKSVECEVMDFVENDFYNSNQTIENDKIEDANFERDNHLE